MSPTATPMMYGAAGSANLDPLTVKPQSRRLNVVAIFVGYFVPWLVFCSVFALISFELHYKMGKTVETLLILFGVLVGLILVRAVMKRSDGWLIFVLASMSIALIAGYLFGQFNYASWMHAYYDLDALNTYTDVDPATMRGQEMMDAGRVTFLSGTPLDLKRSMGFKNLDTYCVAPISSGAVNSGGTALASFDFWAVGINCCSSGGGDFTCGDYDNSKAHSGLRVVRDEERAFYRLAVQQAESVYAIKATHPLFFHWSSDADAELDDYRRYGYQGLFLAMCGYFVFQGVLTCLAVNVAMKGPPSLS